MFTSAYQDGDCVEVLSPAGKNPGSEWKLSGKVARLYEKGVKGYVLAVTGGATSKMQLPKAPKGLLGLRQRHLVLQVLTATSRDKSFSLELGLKDSGGTRRRLVLSSSFKVLHCTPLHAQVPLAGLDRHRGTWANLSLDLAGLMAVCFRADAFRTLESLAIGPTCRLRKIFTMKDGLVDDYEDGEDRDEPIDTADTQGLSEGLEPASMAPVPVRMAFPAGVFPNPRNWVISLSTLRRLATRDIPRPSPLKRDPAAVGTLGNARKQCPVPPPSQSLLNRGPSSVSSSTIPREELSVRVSRTGAGTASLRPSENLSRKPSSSATSRAESTGLLARQRSISSRESRRSSTRPTATPSPRATPTRIRSTVAGRLGQLAPSSSSSGTLGSDTPVGVSARGGIRVGSPGRGWGDTVPFERTDTDIPLSLRRRSPQQAAAAAIATRRSAADGLGGKVDGHHYEEVQVSKTRGMLPARRRASTGRLSSGSVSREGNTGAEDSGGRSEGRSDVRTSRTPAEDWRASTSWKGGKETAAPAWSFPDSIENGKCWPDRDTRDAIPQPKPSYSMTSVLVSPPTSAVPFSSRERSALVSITDGETYGADSGPEGDNERGSGIAEAPSSTSVGLRDALSADVDVSWRDEQYDDGGRAVAPSRGFADKYRLPSPRVKRTSNPSRTPSITTTTNPKAASDGVAGTPTDTSGLLLPANAVVGRKEGDSGEAKPVPAASLFSLPVSARGEVQAASRRSSLALDGGTSDSVGMERSPMSARVDVLRNLLAPGATAEEDPLEHNVSVAAPIKVKGEGSNEVNDTRASMGDLAGANGSHGTGVFARGEISDGAEALEGLLRQSDTIARENGSPNISPVNEFGVTKHSASRSELGGDGSDFRQGVNICGPRTSHSQEVSVRPTQPPARSGVDVGQKIFGRGHESGGRANPRNINEKNEAPAEIHFGGGNGNKCDDHEGPNRLLHLTSRSARSEDWREEQEASRKTTKGERCDELEKLARKEMALLDLEESYHSEFGSVDLSRSPATHDPFSGIHSSPRASAAAGYLDAESSTNTKTLRGSTGHDGPTNRVLPVGSPDFRQRARVGGNANEDTDSVALGSQNSTVSPAPRGEGTVKGGPVRCVGPRAEGGERAAQRGARDWGGGGQTEGFRDELYFDPVLNCYYDRADDKYYGLR